MKHVLIGIAAITALICGLPFLLIMGAVQGVFGDESEAAESAPSVDLPPPPEGSSWMPPSQGRITSGYRTSSRPGHDGVDINDPRGAPIRAAASGTVVTSTCQSSIGCDVDGNPRVTGCGWYVKLQHTQRYQTLYCHMDQRPFVNVGDTVSIGDQLGVVGTTGSSSGPHLHFEVMKNGKNIDPRKFYAAMGMEL